MKHAAGKARTTGSLCPCVSKLRVPLYPLPRRPKRLHNLCLLAAFLRFEVVLPPRRLGERHEDRLDATARLEAEHRSPVVDQVELDVSFPATPISTVPCAREIPSRPYTFFFASTRGVPDTH